MLFPTLNSSLLTHLRLLGCAALVALTPMAHAKALAAGPAVDVSKGMATEVGFSPEGGAERLVLKVINSARTSIRLAGYAFTSPPIVRALTDAKRRGVDVAVVVDHKSNVNDGRTTTSRQALNLLVNAGIPTRTVSAYAIHHDKYIVVDVRHVETGSFNFTTSAARRNSENVLVIWSNPELARQYTAHWQSRWAQGQPYASTY